MKQSKLGPAGVLSVAGRELRRGSRRHASARRSPARASSCRSSRASCARAATQSAVVEGRVEGAAALVWVGAARRGRAARRVTAPASRSSRSATRASCRTCSRPTIVHVPPGQGFPVDEIAHALARKLGEDGTALAARLPVLRGAVCDELIALLREEERDHLGGDLRPRRRHAGADAEPDPARAAHRARLRPGDRQPPRGRAARRRRRRASACAPSPASCSTSSRSRAGR